MVAADVLPHPGRTEPDGGRSPLLGRETEQQHLTYLLDFARSGIGGALVLRGEPGIGKSALLRVAVETAADMRVLRTSAVEAEQGVAFAGLHRLLLPLLPFADRLPRPQRQALNVTFGRECGPAPTPLLVGIAVLGLVSAAGRSRPLLCVVDDAHLLDAASAGVLGFVARRLLDDRVALLAAVQETPGTAALLPALPELHLDGLPDGAAHDL